MIPDGSGVRHLRDVLTTIEKHKKHTRVSRKAPQHIEQVTPIRGAWARIIFPDFTPEYQYILSYELSFVWFANVALVIGR
jgi:hypothetical protein